MKFDQDVRLSLDGLAIQQGGLIAPFADGSHHAWNERDGTIHWLQVLDTPVFVEDSLDTDTSARSHLEMGGLRIDTRKQFTEKHFLAST